MKTSLRFTALNSIHLSRRLFSAILGLLLIHPGVFAANVLLMDEDFSGVPAVAAGPRNLPAGFGRAVHPLPAELGLTNIGGVNFKDARFGALLDAKQSALLLEDRDATSMPFVRAAWNPAAVTTPFVRGWLRICFIPIEDPAPSPLSYVRPQFSFRLRGTENTGVVKFQVNGTRLFFHDQSSTPETGYQFDQAVTLNAVNELLVWFDFDTREIEGRLNGVTLTRRDTRPVADLRTGILPATEALSELEFSVGDVASQQTGVLVTKLELVQGARHQLTKGKFTVTVPPRPIGGRTFDEAPAKMAINFPRLLAEAGYYGRRVKLSSVVVTRPGTSTAAPCRWYDNDTPADFPAHFNEDLGRHDRTSNEFPPTLVTEAGHNLGMIYPVFGNSGIGTLTWLHTQTGDATSTYEIHFETELSGSPRVAPDVLALGWVGDGSTRFDSPTTRTIGTTNVHVAVTDWNGDGLQDIVYGESGGLLFVMLNRGTAANPQFPAHDYIRNENGDPLSIGAGAMPVVVDWDGDGVEDLLVGTHYNRIAYFKNILTNSQRRFRYEGLVKIGSLPLEIPWLPVTGSDTLFRRDYFPTLEAVDWNGDKVKDLLIGGVVTGRIFFYRNRSATNAAVPVLVAPGDSSVAPHYAGIPLNDATGTLRPGNHVGDWNAAPTVADVNGDGLKDLITGLRPMDGQSGSDAPFLRIFINHGTATTPDLREGAFSSYFTGSFPPIPIAAPRLADMNRDGKLDLVVGAGPNIYIFMNTGTASAPRWTGTTEHLATACGPARLNGLNPVQLVDLNGDSQPDIYSAHYFSLMKDRALFPNPYAFEPRTSVYQTGVDRADFVHPSVANPVLGTPGNLTANTTSRLLDLDGDGKRDLLFGDWDGRVWFHRNTGPASSPPFAFQSAGAPCVRRDLSVIDVDLTGAESFDLTDAGARPVIAAADFDGDKHPDLILGDTFGNVRYFKGTGLRHQGAPVFERETWIIRRHFPTRSPKGPRFRLAQVGITDWNGDGKLDVVVSAASAGASAAAAAAAPYYPGGVELYLGDGAGSFTLTSHPDLPFIPVPATIMVDLNGDGGPDDIFMNSVVGSVWIERSFLDAGYAHGTAASPLEPY
ncbi:FG-GAP repeat domain-containing protein [Oleiharenicola lentus]|uniref:FG-GAP repeat domain-containing protein n=1 Tax=Oleiharenicola lentus TaxID=2508720 RepID=UPI003F66626D